MSKEAIQYLVYTVKDRCRVCYTCVRGCPAKAIKIINGQAEVMPERCIGCGYCVKMCSQGAKTFHHSNSAVINCLEQNDKVIACIAPSFPAEFTEFKDYRNFVGVLRKLGFCKVTEVSFGADLVADKYSELIDNANGRKYISSDCPAIVSYIEHYYPNLIENLVPYSSPMDTMAKVVRKTYGDDAKIIFIGPCIAKKTESDSVDLTITFKELREIFAERKIDFHSVKPSDFDGPHAAKGAIFPISRGMLNTMGKNDDFGISRIQVAEGSENFKDAIAEFSVGSLDMDYMELLCCQGCISGPGMTSDETRFKKRSLINKYVSDKFKNTDFDQWEKQKKNFASIDFSREFNTEIILEQVFNDGDLQQVLKSMGKHSAEDFLNCGACGYETCYEHAMAVANGYAEEEMCLPNTIEKLHDYIGELNVTNENLINAKEALKQSEKLAHMGQLSAGIAHELNNPLGVITMYSNILIEETEEDNPIKEDLSLIVEQAERCKRIVGGLLNFARKNQIVLSTANIEALCQRSLKSVIIPANISCSIDNSKLSDPMVNIDKDQMMQVFTNLEKNAFEAMPQGGSLKISLSDSQNPNEVEILVTDSGCGITNDNLTKIFTPFFTTKGISKGTGLGLPLIYGIIKMHKGRISVTSNMNAENGPTGTEFKIVLPRLPQDISLEIPKS